jgi:ligand-binding sensor protein
MELTDILPKEDWAALEREIHEISGMRPRVYDINGMGITDVSFFANDLCARIQSIPKAQTFICAVAQNNMAAMARNTREPVVEECDAGMVKVVIPIFANDEFVGTVGGCGKILDDEEVDTYMIHQSSDLPEEEIEKLAESIPVVTREEMEALAARIEARLEALIRDREPA